MNMPAYKKIELAFGMRFLADELNLNKNERDNRPKKHPGRHRQNF